MSQSPPDELASAFAQIVGSLVAEVDLIDFVHLLTERVASLTETQGVGILATNAGGETLSFVGGSTEGFKVLELFQLHAHEGPGFDAFRTGQSVTEWVLDNAYDRWPSFAPRAVKAGMASVLACPLRVHSRTIGALTIVSDRHEPLNAVEVGVVKTLADLAAIGIALQRTTHPELDSAVVAELLEASDELERIGSVPAADVVRDRARRRLERPSQGAARLVHLSSSWAIPTG